MIRYKSITYDRLEDAPFVGALVCANDCTFNCPGCFNQHLRKLPTRKSTSEAIIRKIKRHGFCEGIILGGLEWTEQGNEMLELIFESLQASLKVMLYTHLSLPTLLCIFPELKHQPILVKCGEYDNTQQKPHVEFDVRLSTANQHIYDLSKCSR